MAAGGGTAGARGSGRRWRRIALAGAALLVAAYAFRSRVIAPWVVAWVAGELSERHALELSVGEVGGNWFTTLELADVRLASSDGSLVVALRALHADFSLADVLSRGPLAIELVRASGLDLAFDRRLRLPREVERVRPPGAGFAWPERWPRLAIDDSRAALDLGGGRTLELAGLELESADGERVVCRCARAAYASPETSWPAGPCEAELRVDDGRLQLARLALGGADAGARASVDLAALAEGRIEWDATLAPGFGRVATRGTLTLGAAAALDARVSLEDADGVRLRELFPPLARRSWSGRLDVEAEIRAALQPGGELELALRGSVRDGAFAGQRFDRLAAELVATREHLLFSRLEAQRGDDRLAAIDLVMPFDVASSGGLRGRVSLDTADVPALFGSPDLGRDVPPHRAHLAVTFTDAGVVVDEGRVTTRSGALDVDAGRVTFGEGPERWLADARFEIAGRADFPDLSELGGTFGREGWCGSARGRVALSGGFDAPVGVLDLEGSNVELEGRELGDVRVEATVDRERVRVARARAGGAWGELSVSGDLDLRELRLFDVRAEARLALPAPWTPPGLSAGSLEARASIDGELAEPRVEFGLSARDVAWRDRRLESVEMRGLWQGDTVRWDHWVVRGYGLEAVATGQLSSLGWSAPFTLELESLHAEREGRSLDLVAPVELRIGDGSVDFDRAHLAGDAGRWIAACHWSREHTVLDVELVELSPLGLFDPFLPAGVSVDGLHAKLQLLREGPRLSAAFDVRADRARFHAGGREYALATRGLFDERRLDLERLELVEGERQVLSLSGSAPLDPFGDDPLAPGELDLDAALAIQFFEELPESWRPHGAEPSGQLAVDLSVQGTWREPRGRLSLQACDLELDGVGPLAGRRLGPWDVEADVAFDREMRIERLHVVDRGRAEIFVSGDVEVALRALDWLEVGAPSAADVGLELVAAVDVDDLAFLRRLAPELGTVEGRASAEVAIGASAAAPTWSGTLAVAEGEIRFEDELPKIGGFAADVAFSGYTATLRSFSGMLGSGPFEGSGTIELAEGAPRFDLRANGREILLVRSDHLRLRADAELALAGPLDALRVGGELRLRDGRFTQDFDLLERFGGSARRRRASSGRGFSLPAVARGPLASAELDVRVRSAEPLRVDNNVLRAGLRPNLVLRGRGSAPRLAGPIFVENARIALPSGTLRVVTGTIDLPEIDPLVPKVKARGEARIAGYDVVASLDGDYDDPIVLSSSPPLSQSDLVVLLLTGRPPAGSLSATGEQAAQSVAFYLGQDVLSRWFQGEDGESLVERIEWLQGQELTKSGGQTTQVSLRLTEDDGDARRVVYLRGEKDVYDRVNFGVKLLFRFP